MDVSSGKDLAILPYWGPDGDSPQKLLSDLVFGRKSAGKSTDRKLIVAQRCCHLNLAISNGHLQFRIKEETGEGIVLLGISPAFNNQKYYNTFINTGANNFNIDINTNTKSF